MHRRRFLLGAIPGLAGCGAVDWIGRETSTPAGAPVEAAGGDLSHPIVVDNRLGVTAAVTLAVEREEGVLYEETHRVGPGRRAVVAGFTETELPEGGRYVTVTATTPDGATASVGVSVTACLGDVVVRLGTDGPSVTYSRC